MMVNQHMDCLPQVVIDECLQAPGFPRTLEEHVTPERWKASMDDLYVHLHHTNNAALLGLAGQWHFPGSLHAYGKTKRNFRVIGSIVLAYEMLCRKVFLMQHPTFSIITHPPSVDHQQQLAESGRNLRYDSPILINGMRKETCSFYVSLRNNTAMRKGWCSTRHSDSLHVHVAVTSSRPRHVIISVPAQATNHLIQKLFTIQ